METGLISEEYIKNNHWNPARAHALRSAFASLLRSQGVDEQDIDFMLGHKIPYQQAYYQKEGERLRKTYADVMNVLSVYETFETVSDLEKRLREQGKIINSLVRQNVELESKIRELERQVSEQGQVIDELQKRDVEDSPRLLQQTQKERPELLKFIEEYKI
ncbi:hypothetical protein J7L00_00810 [Candidatus Bathyarchaeota archaeon]|nr:hypothetical protein [Candidatus Bathyarchaeota archaeon]